MYDEHEYEECELTLYITFNGKCNKDPIYIPCKEATELNDTIFWCIISSAKQCGQIDEDSVDCWAGFDTEEDERLQQGTLTFIYQYNLIADNDGEWDEGDSDYNAPGDSYGWEPPGWIEEPTYTYLRKIDYDKFNKISSTVSGDLDFCVYERIK